MYTILRQLLTFALLGYLICECNCEKKKCSLRVFATSYWLDNNNLSCSDETKEWDDITEIVQTFKENKSDDELVLAVTNKLLKGVFAMLLSLDDNVNDNLQTDVLDALCSLKIKSNDFKIKEKELMNLIPTRNYTTGEINDRVRYIITCVIGKSSELDPSIGDNFILSISDRFCFRTTSTTTTTTTIE
ncbi:uncharacterized protein [Antedon mediterranea]|uniref:uncharacterized protein n=1 Tax=Antedon mediterranea TaxID=105859 RepID=UPI003AF95286